VCLTGIRSRIIRDAPYVGHATSSVSKGPAELCPLLIEIVF
jgi:hypothetical protein